MKHNYIAADVADEKVAVNKVSRFVFCPTGWGEFLTLSAKLESQGVWGIYDAED